MLQDNRQIVLDILLARERLDRKVKESGGYIGFIDKVNSDFVMTNSTPDLVKFFETSKKVDIDSLNNQSQHAQSPTIKIPTFAELKELALKYEIFIDSKDPFDSDTSKIKIRDIETGQIQTDISMHL